MADERNRFRLEHLRSGPRGAWILSVLLALAALQGAAQEVQLNATTTGDQIAPRLVHLDVTAGNIAVWSSTEGFSQNLRGAKAQSLGFGDSYLRWEFEVALDIPGGLVWWEVVQFETLNTFAVVWEAGDGTVNAQCFRVDSLNPVGGPVELASNGVGRGGTIHPGISTARVAWWADDGSGGAVRHSLELGFNCAIVPPALDPLAFDCEEPAAASNGTVDATVCREPVGAGLGPADSDIHLVVVTATGTTDLVLNTYTTGIQLQPSIAAGANGEFVVAWTSFGSPGDDTFASSVQARRLDSTGSPVGDQFQVNSYTIFYQLNPSVAVEDDGAFVVVWDSFGSDGTDQDGASIQARRFAAGGGPPGDQLQVNSYTTSIQERPAVAAADSGVVFITWNSAGSAETDTDGYSIQGLALDFFLLFGDGFERGDLTKWSSTAP